MPKRICIVRHITREGPGSFLTHLKRRGMDIHQYDLSQNPALPHPSMYDGILVMGGPDSANDASEKMNLMRAFVEKTLQSEVPYFGICLGMQLLVKAAGGLVVKSPRTEIGFYDPQNRPYENILTDEGRKEPLLRGLPDRFPVFHLHGETVVLTPGMVLLATAAQCPNQFIRVGRNAYGLQGHPELTPEMLEVWLRKEPYLQDRNAAQLKREMEALGEDYSRVAGTLIQNWPL